MCGILGTINKSIDNELLSEISHRGPDDFDLIKKTIQNNDIFLGHVRLSIQDLTQAGHQPMYSHCKKFIIIFNGEIYNHMQLREKLPNIVFNGHSDTETIVNYIARYGILSIKEFNGIFAFALLDIESNKLFIVRDRYGVKPIYFTIKEEELIFSSEIRPIKKLVNSSINKDNLATLLKLRYNPSPTTLYDKIEKLRPGHILEYNLSNHTTQITSYIETININSKISFDDAIKKYGELFEQAIKKQLLADVEVGVLLSGGIDSALVAYYAQKYSDKSIKTFTIGFHENDESDETIDAKETARILGTEHFEIKISESEFEDKFQKCIDIIEEPLGTTSIIPMYFLNELVSKHLKVVLTGQGADEPLGGYNRYRGELLHNKFPSFIFNILKPLLPYVKKESIYRAIDSLGEKNIIKRFNKIYSLFGQNEIKNLIKVDENGSEKLITYFYELLEGKKKDSTSAMMANDIRMNLSDDLLLYTDKISMNFSIEARVPMLDNDLIDFIESLPLEYKIKGKEAKYIHKKFAETVLPKEIIYRKKKGFKSPTEKWFKGEKGLQYKKLLISNNSSFSNIFDLNEVSKMFEVHINGKRNMEKQLFTLISIYYWMINNEK
jgi:asparagine synthase (glutamine-hydrolysing)